MFLTQPDNQKNSQGKSIWQVSSVTAFLLIAVIPPPANAATVVMPLSDGFVSNSDGSFVSDRVGAVVGKNIATFRRGWFFDLSSLTADVVAAELAVTIFEFHPSNNVDATERIDLYAVSATRQQLKDADTSSGTPPSPPDIFFDDFGSGVSYGSLVVETSSPNGSIVTAQLNSNAVAAINDATGGDFSIGLVLGTLDSGARTEYVGVYSDRSRHTLSLTTVIPEPSTSVVVAYTLSSLGMIRRRRRS